MPHMLRLIHTTIQFMYVQSQTANTHASSWRIHTVGDMGWKSTIPANYVESFDLFNSINMCSVYTTFKGETKYAV